MTKHSKHEREQRAAQTELVRQQEAAWFAALPSDVAKAHTRDVEAARARGPLPPPPLQNPAQLLLILGRADHPAAASRSARCSAIMMAMMCGKPEGGSGMIDASTTASWSTP